MTINIIQTITNTLTAERQIINSKAVESFAIYPAENKVLRNKITGTIVRHLLVLSSEQAIVNYEEIDDPDIKQ